MLGMLTHGLCHVPADVTCHGSAWHRLSGIFIFHPSWLIIARSSSRYRVAKYGSRQAKVEAQNVYSLFSCLIIRFFVVIVIFGINDHCLGKMLTVWGGDRSLNRRAAAFMRRCCESVKIVVMLKVKSPGNLLIVSSTFTNQKPPWLYLSVNYLWGPILCNLGRTQFYLTLESFISREKNNAIRFWLCNLHNWNNNTKLNILQLDFEFAKHDAWKMK